MKKIRVGNTNYRAKQCGKYPSGENRYLYQFQPLLFGLIPLPWASYDGTFSLDYIEKQINDELNNYTGEIADLNIQFKK